MATLTVTEEQLQLIQRSLDFYSRVGIGQFEEIKNHPTFEKHLHREFEIDGKTDYSRYHAVRDSADNVIFQARNILYNDNSLGKNGSWGIYNPKVDESCREAFDLIQVIRHEFWKSNPKRSRITVDSSVHLHCKDSDKIKVEL